MAGYTEQPDEQWLKKRIQAIVSAGINSEDGEVTDVRQSLFNAYMGDLIGNERAGKSQIVTRELLQAVEWAIPALMRVFFGGVKAVSFKPTGPDDVEQSKLETDIVNDWFADGNPNQSGFMILYAFIKDLLMFPNAYIQVEPTEEEERDVYTLTDATPEQLEDCEARGCTVDVDDEKTTLSEDPLTGEAIELYEAKITDVKTVKRVECATLSPDSVIVDHNHHELSLEKCRAVIVRNPYATLSDVRELGYDLAKEDVEPADDDDTWNDEATTRLFYSDEQPGNDDDSYETEADCQLTLHTCYMRVDWDGDGIAELRRVLMAGCAIIENEEWEQQTVVAGSALPMPHKHVGMGYGELVLDLQHLNTTLVRQLLDNIYAQNIQRVYLNEASLLSDGSTMDALLDDTQQYITMRGVPAENVMPEVVTPIVAEITGAIEALKEQPQLRTGVAPQLSLDPSVLEKSTMGAFVGALDQASQRLELLARLVAETVLKPVFLKIHHTLRTHFDEPQQVQFNGKWVTVDPRTWKKRSSMTVNVGLGFNNKQMMLTLLQSLLMIQKEAMGLGLADASKIYATLEVLIEQCNLGHAGTYFLDPKDPEWKAPPPVEDPAMIQAKANAGALQAEAKRKDKELDHKVQMDREGAEQKAADATNTLLQIKDKDALTTAQIAKTRAEITHLNMDKNAQAGPAEDSADDEFARAAGIVGDTAGDRQADREAGKKPKPAEKPAKPAEAAKKRMTIERGPDGKVSGAQIESETTT